MDKIRKLEYDFFVRQDNNLGLSSRGNSSQIAYFEIKTKIENYNIVKEFLFIN